VGLKRLRRQPYVKIGRYTNVFFPSCNCVPSRRPVHAAVTRPHLNTSRETISGLMTTSLADDYDRRQVTTHKLVVRSTRLRTIGDRAFGSAAPRMWNNLPTDVITA